MKPPKTKEETKEEEVQEIEPLQIASGKIEEIKHVFRVLSLDGLFHPEGAQPANVVEDYLKQQYLAQGYDLYQISQVRVVAGSEGKPLGQEMLYVFVKYAQ